MIKTDENSSRAATENRFSALSSRPDVKDGHKNPDLTFIAQSVGRCMGVLPILSLRTDLFAARISQARDIARNATELS